MTDTPIIVGIDTGGTFTDLVAIAGKHLCVHKVLSTPDDPARAVLTGLKAMLAGLKAMGVHIAIDDFAFGVASVSADGFASPVVFPGAAGAFWAH